MVQLARLGQICYFWPMLNLTSTRAVGAVPLAAVSAVHWEAAWRSLSGLPDALQPAALLRIVTIRGAAFQTLRIPRGQSQKFTHQMTARL